MLLAPAVLSVLITPLAADAADLNIDSVSDYSATLDLEQAKQLLQQVTSVNQFNDVYPTDWAYQALVRLVKSYGCVAGYPNGSFRGHIPITRYEAAALLASCLDRVTEMTEDVERLMEEFKTELNFVAGSIMLLEDRVGTLEANQFSTTTKFRGKSVFTMGATKAYGTQNGSKYTWNYDKKYKMENIDGNDTILGETTNSRYWKKTREAWLAVHNKDGTIRVKGDKQGLQLIEGTDLEKHYKNIQSRRFRQRKNFSRDGTAGAARGYNNNYGAWSFNYEQKLHFKTSFTGKDLLYASFTAGNFCDTGFNGEAVALTKLNTAPCTDNMLGLGRLYYRFPYKNDELINHSVIFIAGPMARNSESLGIWPSAYNRGADRILEWTSLAGAPNVYNKATGPLFGIIYKEKPKEKGDPVFSFSLNYVSLLGRGNSGDSTTGGFMTDNSASSVLAQVGWGGAEYGVAFAYRYGQCGTGLRRGTNFLATSEYNTECYYDVWNWDDEPNYQGDFIGESTGRSTNNFAISGYWVPETSGWIPSISVSYAESHINGKGFYKGSPLSSSSWFVGLKWDDVFEIGNDIGFAFGQPNRATNLHGDYQPYDGNYLLELYASFQVTDNIMVTPSLFWLSRPLGQDTHNFTNDQDPSKGSTFGIFGGLIQSTFRF